MFYRSIGVDLGVTAQHKAHVCDEQGRKITGSSFRISKENLDALCNQALKNASQGTKLRFICEPTSMSWFPLAIYAKNNNHEMIRVKSHKTHDFRKFFSRNKKNDKFDAKILAIMPAVDEKTVEKIYLPKAKVFALERCNRQRERITREIASIKNRLSSLFHWVMPGLLDCFEDAFDNRAIEFYRRFSNPFRAKKSGLKGVRKVLDGACRQSMKSDLPGKLYSVVCNACELYSNSSEWIDFDEIQGEVQIELQLLETLKETLSAVKERVESLYRDVYPERHIETIKGIGENLGASIVGIIGDPNRFSSQDKLRCFAGLIPKQDDSGESNKKGLPLTQEGSARFRRDLFLAADVARQWDPQLAKIYYEGMVNKGHHHYQAICSVMSHLINRILCVLKENRPYELRDTDGNPVTTKQAKQIIKEHFIVPEEIRERTRSKRSRKNKKEEHIRNLFKRQPDVHWTPQNSYNIPPNSIIQNFEKLVKVLS